MNRTILALALLLCVLPGAIFSFSLLAEHRAYFWDGTVYRCAIEATLATGNPYRFIGECAGYFLPHTYPYAGTHVLAALTQALGLDAMRGLYLALYLSGTALFIHTLRRLNASPASITLLILAPGAGVFVSEFVSGNMGIPFYGFLIWLLARSEGQSRAVTILAACMAPFKPLYGSYVLLPFLLRREWLLPAAMAVSVGLWYLADALLFREQFTAWLGAAVDHANAVPGFGFSMLIRKGGLALESSALVFAAYALWVACIIALTLRAVRQAPTPLVAAFVALAGTALLLPRLKEYDCLVLIPLSCALWSATPRRERQEWFALVGGFALVLPALVWWIRKVPLLWTSPHEPWRAFVDMRWLVQHQGGFLFAAMLAALLLIAFRRAPVTPDTTRPRPESV